VSLKKFVKSIHKSYLFPYKPLFFRNSLYIVGLLLPFLISSCQGEISTSKNDSSTLQQDTLEVKRLLALSEKSLNADFELSIKQAIKATKIAEKTPFHSITFEAYKTVAKAALHSGAFEILEIYLHKFLVLAEQDKDEKMIGRAYANLAMLHLYLNETHKADSLFVRGLAMIEHHAKEKHEKISEEDQIVIYLNLGHIYSENNQLRKAESTYLRGLNLAQNKPTFVSYQGQFTQSLGIFYLKQKQAKKAKKYLDLAFKIQQSSHSDAMIPITYLSFGEYYEMINKPDQASSSYEEGLTWAKKIKSIGLMIELSDHLYRFHKAHGNYQKALNYLNLNLEQNELSKKEIAKTELLRKSIERKILIQEAEEVDLRKRQSVYVALLLLFVLVITIFFTRKSESDSEKIDFLNREKVGKDKLEIELQVTQQNMAKNALLAIQKEESLNQVVEKIKKNQDNQGANSQVLRTLSNDLEKINKTKNWDEFEKSFVGIHVNFFQNLAVTHPDLSNNERRLCAFLKIDLSTKEISKLTGQTIRAIELSRIRLRKKLKLTNTDQGIFQYLSNL